MTTEDGDADSADPAQVNLKEIAALAGVSVPTVSKVLNGRQGVSEATRDAVNALLEEHGYRRRGTDRRSRVGLVDLVIDGLGSMWSLAIADGASTEAARAGVGLVITQTSTSRPTPHRAVLRYPVPVVSAQVRTAVRAPAVASLTWKSRPCSVPSPPWPASPIAASTT